MINSNKKIILFSSFDGTTGGQAINAAVFSCEFLKRGYNILNICYSQKNVNLKFCGELKNLNIPFVKQIKNPVLNTVVKPVQFLIGIFALQKFLRNQEKQKIICFGWGASLLAVVSKKIFYLNNIDVICRVGTRFEEEFIAERSWIKRVKLKIVDVMIKSLYKDASMVSPISKHLEKFLIENYNISDNKIKVLYNPRNEKEIISLSKEEPKEDIFSHGLPIIVTCGRLTIPKGQWHLIRAFSIVRKKIPCKLLILGEGDLKSYLSNLAKDLNLSKDVIFVGWQENPFKYFSRSDVFVLNSSWEGFANVILEAMICGLPIISSDCYSGPREILAPNTDLNYKTDKIEHAEFGILVPSDDRKFYNANDPITKEEQLLANSILEMLENKSLRDEYKKKSIKRAEDFNIDKVIEDWIKAIESN
jgi:glycosyltransferase involved in cell wall biosynthesis